jgi:putative endonuclease
MPRARVELGQRGEDLAGTVLTHRGYAILARRYRTRHGEIDIIARHRDAIVFVEVKARRWETCGAPAESITPAKQRRIAVVATDYLADRGWLEVACRFDVVSVWFHEDGGSRVEVLEGAF